MAALDGYSGHEHTYTTTPLFRDVLTMLATSQITYTPVMIVSYGGPTVQSYLTLRGDPRSDRKFVRFMPPEELDRLTLRSSWVHESQWLFPRQAADAGRILAAGGRVGL